ncbi:hypothetical protein HDC30_005784 [Pseudomonas sp. JAI115]|uniref:DUF4376 domain-containing protein n=1 Tax=Pseudomonas sp. JAI115 TaxID=2723061 RepID=UPI001614C17D|nr:hypothetical protein [Pseudomonas sp. JAI115]MBB6158526.1 hypothetical protein [Pseudomonas sp. JAI115]
MSKTVYQTNAQGLYVGQVEAEESPLEPGVFLIPAGCVQTPPPAEIPPLKAACWNGKAWQLVDYFNGLVVYDTQTRQPLTLTGIGPIPNGYTTQRPEPDQQWKKGRWVDDLPTQLAKLHVVKLALINEGCAAFIAGGFSSKALGKPYRYDSTLEDQVNLTAMIQSGLDGLCACRNSSGHKALIEHSTNQLQTVGQDLVKFKQQALQRAEQLKAELAQTLAEQDLAAMKQIEWRPPA